MIFKELETKRAFSNFYQPLITELQDYKLNRHVSTSCHRKDIPSTENGMFYPSNIAYSVEKTSHRVRYHNLRSYGLIGSLCYHIILINDLITLSLKISCLSSMKTRLEFCWQNNFSILPRFLFKQYI